MPLVDSKDSEEALPSLEGKKRSEEESKSWVGKDQESKEDDENPAESLTFNPEDPSNPLTPEEAAQLK